MLFPWKYSKIWHAHVKFFILHFLAQLRTLKPLYYNAILSETRAIRCIYYVYSVFLLVVTIQYTEISHRHRGIHVAEWALDNVTTCHIGCLKMLFHAPSPNTECLPLGCLCLLIQVASSGSFKFHTLLRWHYKQLLINALLGDKCHVRCGNKHPNQAPQNDSSFGSS